MRPIMIFTITIIKTLIVLTTAVDKERSYSIHHNLGFGFKPRTSKIHVAIENALLTTNIVPTTTENTATCDNNEQCEEEMSLFRSLLENNKMYQVKVIDEETKNEVIMSVPSCSVLRSNFREEITLHLNPTADLISISYKPLISPLAPKQCILEKIPVKVQINFKTTVTLDTFTPAMTVPQILPSYRPPADIKYFTSSRARLSQQQQQQQQVGPDGKPIPGTIPDAQNQSFLRKYWYLILPLMIMSLSGNAPPPEEEGAAQGSGTTTGARVATAASGAAVASAQVTGARSRRGKRN